MSISKVDPYEVVSADRVHEDIGISGYVTVNIKDLDKFIDLLTEARDFLKA